MIVRVNVVLNRTVVVIVTVNNNSPIQDYVHPHDHTQPTYTVSQVVWSTYKVYIYLAVKILSSARIFSRVTSVFQTCFCIFKTGNSLTLQRSAKKLLHFV